MKTITSHKDLLERKLELQSQLEEQRGQIRQDLLELKESMGPILNIASLVTKATTRDSRGNVLVKTGANLAIDWATRKLMPKGNSLLGTIGGFFAKNLASHLFNRRAKADAVVNS
jgi:hypothetical protein